MGYSTTLEIRADGTFTKRQEYRTSAETFNGTYTALENGLIQFHADERVDSLWGLDQEPLEIDRTFRCRCAVDDGGHLVVYEYEMWRVFDEESDLKWEIYQPAN